MLFQTQRTSTYFLGVHPCFWANNAGEQKKFLGRNEFLGKECRNKPALSDNTIV